MCSSPTVAELSPPPTQTHSKEVLPSLIWLGGGAGPRPGRLQWVGGCGIKSECLHPSVAAGQPGRSAPGLTQPGTQSSWTRYKEKSRRSLLVLQSKRVGMCRDPSRKRRNGIGAKTCCINPLVPIYMFYDRKKVEWLSSHMASKHTTICLNL